VNTTHVSELLDRAAASVTPAETDPATRLVRLGRRSVQRRRRAWGSAGSVAVAVAVAAAAVVALPQLGAPPKGVRGRRGHGEPGWPVGRRPGGLAHERGPTFDPCTAEPRIVYLVAGWGPQATRPTAGPPGACNSEGQAWIAVVHQGVAPLVNPNRLVVKDGQLLQVEQSDQHVLPSVWTYRAFSNEIQATTAFISGDDKSREQLLKRVTWPAGPPAPASGGRPRPRRGSRDRNRAPALRPGGTTPRGTCERRSDSCADHSSTVDGQRVRPSLTRASVGKFRGHLDEGGCMETSASVGRSCQQPTRPCVAAPAAAPTPRGRA